MQFGGGGALLSLSFLSWVPGPFCVPWGASFPFNTTNPISAVGTQQLNNVKLHDASEIKVSFTKPSSFPEHNNSKFLGSYSVISIRFIMLQFPVPLVLPEGEYITFHHSFIFSYR